MQKHKILITIDGSEFSRLILPRVRTFFSPQDSELILLSVAVEPFAEHFQRTPLTTAQSIVPLYREDEGERVSPSGDFQGGPWEELISKLRYELKLVANELAEAGYKVSTVVRASKDPAEEIIAVGKSESADLIAMTTHGRTGAKRLLMGSVAEQVLRKSSVPVMIFRPQ
jgi:nucleotide-binding universal stress UspA family protein